jgi:hypothetical protein
MLYYDLLDRRINTFSKSLSLIKESMKKDTPYTIVELGTSRSFVNGGYDGCCSPDPIYWSPKQPKIWDWGAGVFTKVFSDNLRNDNVKLYSIDPNEGAIFISSTMCKGNSNVKIIKDYSTNFLNSIDFKIDFLYMDHMESGEDACIQHLNDSKLIVEKNLMSDNGIILIDDVGTDLYHTKGKYSIPYLLENGYNLVLHEYQVLLVRSTK